LNTLEHQPAKVAAMEGNWDTRTNVPLLLFAIPDDNERTNHWELGIPSGASLILKHSPDGVIPGLNDFVATDGSVNHPPVAPVFWGFRIMVGTGMLMLLVSWSVAWHMKRHKTPGKFGAYALVGMMFSGWVATLAGWYVTEIGRQPWLVTGVLDTKSAVATHPVAMLGLSLITYLLIYALLLAAYIATLLHLTRKASRQPVGELDSSQFKGAVAGALS
jgi:cytochrome d ubiquinol oxidase subunit I